MTKALFMFFILLNLIYYGQNKTIETIRIQKSKDTIDYSSFSFGIQNQYLLEKIVQFKGQTIYDMKGRQLFFVLATDTGKLERNSDLRTQIGDTLITLWWDIDVKNVYETVKKVTGIIRLDRNRSILFIEKELYDSKTKQFKVITKKFQINKWTRSRIILKDISNPEFDRTFIFKRSPPIK